MELGAVHSNSDFYDYQKYFLLIILGPRSGVGFPEEPSLRQPVLGSPSALGVL